MLPSASLSHMIKFTIWQQTKTWLWPTHQPNANAMKCHSIYSSLAISVKISGMESAILTMPMIGKDLLNNLELIMFMKLSWEVEQSKKYSIHGKAYLKWKVWPLISTLLQKLPSPNFMQILPLITINTKPKLNMLKHYLRAYMKSISVGSHLKQERSAIGKKWSLTIQCQ